MEYVVTAIFDAAAACYGPPQVSQTAGIAMRQFEDMVLADSPNVVSKHPHHFILFQVARYDDSCGRFINEDTVLQLCTGDQVKVAHNPPVDKRSAQ